MSKKKQKPITPGEFHAAYGVPSQSIPLQLIPTPAEEKLDEIIDLLHVLVENTKKPEPPKGMNFNIQTASPEDVQRRLEGRDRQEHQRRLNASVDGSWIKRPAGTDKARVEIAREEVEDYHGIATTEPYSLPVRIHR